MCFVGVDLVHVVVTLIWKALVVCVVVAGTVVVIVYVVIVISLIVILCSDFCPYIRLIFIS